MSLDDAPNIRLSLLCDSGPNLCVQVDAPPYRYVSVEGPVDTSVHWTSSGMSRWHGAPWVSKAEIDTCRGPLKSGEVMSW